MATKSDFNADEWSVIVEGPVLAGMRVVAVGRGGTIRDVSLERRRRLRTSIHEVHPPKGSPPSLPPAHR